MKKLLNISLLIASLLFSFSCVNEAAKEKTTEAAKTEAKKQETVKESKADPIQVYRSEAGREVPYYQYAAFKKAYLEKDNDTTYLVNFWATWCGPCVKELPYFFEAEAAFEEQPVKFIYASLDFKKQIEQKLLRFVDKRKMDATVVVLDQKNAEWIKDVDKNWEGAIPATLIFNKKGSKFYRQSFESTEEVKKIIEPYIN